MKRGLRGHRMFSLAQSSKAEATRQDAWPSAPQDAAKHILMVPESVYANWKCKMV